MNIEDIDRDHPYYANFKRADQEINSVLPGLEAMISAMPVLRAPIIENWTELYIPADLPDEISGPSPTPQKFTSYVTLLHGERDLLNSLDVVVSESMVAQMARAVAHTETWQPKPFGKELLLLYQKNRDIFENKNIPPELRSHIATVFGWEYGNFGIPSEGDSTLAPFMREICLSPLLPEIMADVRQLTFVTTWKYGRKTFAKNIALYHPFALALDNSAYPTEEKKNFLTLKPLFPHIDPEFRSDQYTRPYDYTSGNLDYMRQYISLLTSVIAEGNHPTLADAQKATLKLVIDKHVSTSTASLAARQHEAYRTAGIGAPSP